MSETQNRFRTVTDTAQMTDQIPLFVEDYNEAIQATVMALGGFKRMGAELYPELPADAAGRRLSDCCNNERRDVLAPQHLGMLRRMARTKGVHILAAYEMREAGYSEPLPLEPEDERAALQREFVLASKSFQNLVGRMERVGLRVAA